MKRQTLALVVVGVLLFIAGGGIAYVTSVKGAKGHSNAPTVVAPVTTPAVVAKSAIPAGTTGQAMISKGLVSIQLIPQKTYVPTDLPNTTGLTDEVLTTSLAKGQAVQTTELIASTSTISIPTGLQAVTINMSGVSGLAGYLQPGSDVDVYANVNKLSAIPGSTAPAVPANTPVPCTELLMTSVQVLDVSDTSPAYDPHTSTGSATPATDDGRTIPPLLTLLVAVTPTQAQTISFFQQNESLSVAQTQPSAIPPALSVCLGTGVLTQAP